jgi:hypothetical protein
VPTARRGLARVAVKIDPDVWRDEVERFDARSSARITAQRERRQLEAEGVPLRQLQRCEDLGDDHTRLPGLVKVYVPIIEGAPSERPYAMVFSPEPGPLLMFVAFGERHPRTATRSVYERAHKRLHGRYPDE